MRRRLALRYRAPRGRGSGRRAKSSGSRHWLRLVFVATLALVGSVVLVLGLQRSGEPPSPGADEWAALPTETPTLTSPSAGPTLDHSAPSRLDIPAVNIHTRLLRLGLNDDGTLEMPWRPLLAGWYGESPTPGERGPAVIVGHVDSTETGPAVFYRLGELITGDTIRVSRQDGTRAVFRVTAVRLYPRSEFPTAAVYGDTARSTLRLITCGDWDEHAEKYVGNVVVFADLVAPRT